MISAIEVEERRRRVVVVLFELYFCFLSSCSFLVWGRSPASSISRTINSCNNQITRSKQLTLMPFDRFDPIERICFNA